MFTEHCLSVNEFVILLALTFMCHVSDLYRAIHRTLWNDPSIFTERSTELYRAILRNLSNDPPIFTEHLGSIIG